MKARSALSFFLLLASFACNASARVPHLLETALQKLVDAEDEWAYTQVYRRVDRPNAETVARFDPSKQHPHQWELVKLRGETPTRSEAERWCKRRSQENVTNDASALADLMDLDRAVVSSETGSVVTFEVPLKRQTIKRVPAENFIVYAEVSRETQALNKLSVTLREGIRIFGGIAQIESAQGEVVFQSLARDEPPRPVYISARGHGQALFRKVFRSAEIFYVDQRRVRS